MTRKLAIISTSDAIRDVVNGDYSPSEKLLKLLEEGYEVVVITTRESLSNIDRGWRYLIRPENIYFPIGKLTCRHAEDPAYRRSWEVVFDRFGLTAPEGDRIDYRYAAKEQGVVI